MAHAAIIGFAVGSMLLIIISLKSFQHMTDDACDNDQVAHLNITTLFLVPIADRYIFKHGNDQQIRYPTIRETDQDVTRFIVIFPNAKKGDSLILSTQNSKSNASVYLNTTLCALEIDKQNGVLQLLPRQGHPRYATTLSW